MGIKVTNFVIPDKCSVIQIVLTRRRMPVGPGLAIAVIVDGAASTFRPVDSSVLLDWIQPGEPLQIGPKYFCVAATQSGLHRFRTMASRISRSRSSVLRRLMPSRARAADMV